MLTNCKKTAKRRSVRPFTFYYLSFFVAFNDARMEIVYNANDSNIIPDVTKMQTRETIAGIADPKIGQTICKHMIKYNATVANFPCHSAPVSSSALLNNTKRRINEIVSLTIKIPNGNHITGNCVKRQINTMPCVTLSATGSINFPKSVIMLNFLAINPSTISVNPEMRMTRIVHSKDFSKQYSQTITGTNASLKKDKIFGIVKICFNVSLERHACFF